MDIRLIRNFENSQCYSLDGDLILQAVDDNYQMNEFIGKKLYVVNVDTNLRQEILPGVKKFQMAEIYDIAFQKKNVYFITASRENEDLLKLTLIRYNVTNGTNSVIYSFEMSIYELEQEKRIKIFVLDDNYVFFQFESPIEQSNDNYQVPIYIENYLYSVEDNHVISIEDKIIAKSGIEKIVPIEGNICCIKIGYSILEEGLCDNISQDMIPDEIIGTVNIKQFISDLVLKKDHVYIDELDRGTNNRTFPYMKYRENSILYSRVDLKNRREEVVIYEYETNITKVRVNNNLVRVSDLWHTYLINDTPYLLLETEKNTKLINLNTQKIEWKLGCEYSVEFIKNDIIVISKHIHKNLFRKGSNCILVYRYPDIHDVILKEKAQYQNCLVTTDDKLLIFSN